MKLVQAIIAATIGTLAISSAASADTVATFADPAARARLVGPDDRGRWESSHASPVARGPGNQPARPS